MSLDPRNVIEWRPNKPQEKFLQIPQTIKEGMMGGGNGSGKTDVLLLYGILNRWHENPNFKQVFMRRTRPELRNEVVGRSRELFRPFGAKYNATDMIWTFPRLDQYGSGMRPEGALIFLSHCEREDDVHDWDTAQINLFTPDEITSFTEWQYLYITFERTRTKIGVGLSDAIARCTGTPGNIGHTWVGKRFYHPCKKGDKIIEGRGGNKRIFIFATLADNPHCDPKYAQGLEALPEAEKKAKLYGDWDAYLGQVFDEFRDRHYVDEPENALHVIEPFQIPEWWPKFVVGDWGFRAMTWIGFAAVSPDKRVYIYNSLYWYKTKITEWGAILKEYIDKENPRIIKFCRSARQDRGLEHTIQTQIEEAIGRSIEMVNSSPGSRVAGKQLLHEYLRWKVKYYPTQDPKEYNHEHALWLMRNKGEREYNSYIDSFNPPIIEENLPKLQIFKTLENEVLISAIKACVYAKPINGIPAEDVAEFDGDDPYDGIRYIVDEADRYFNEAADEFIKIQARAALIKKLEESQDWTAFYRNMRKVESNSGVRPVRRFHRGSN
jgi:hypothetical protein